MDLFNQVSISRRFLDFLLIAYSLPVGAIALILLLLSMPWKFPRHFLAQQEPVSFSRQTLAKVDFIGCLLLLAACVILECALEEAGIRYAWSSAVIIFFLAFSAVLFVVFLAWQIYASRQATISEPLLPWRLLKSRLCLGMFLYRLSIANVLFTRLT